MHTLFAIYRAQSQGNEQTIYVDEASEDAKKDTTIARENSQKKTIYVNFTQINNQSFRMTTQSAEQREQLHSNRRKKNEWILY